MEGDIRITWWMVLKCLHYVTNQCLLPMSQYMYMCSCVLCDVFLCVCVCLQVCRVSGNISEGYQSRGHSPGWGRHEEDPTLFLAPKGHLSLSVLFYSNSPFSFHRLKSRKEKHFLLSLLLTGTETVWYDR